MFSITPITKTKYATNKKYTFTINSEIKNIPIGFSSDGATIFFFFWSIFGSPFSPKLVEAAFVHDYLISIGYDGNLRDKKFYELLLLKNNPIKSKIMYFSVFSWRKLKTLMMQINDIVIRLF